MPVLDKVLNKWEQLDKVAHDYLVPITSQARYRAALALLEAVWEKVGEDPHSPYGSLFILLTERIGAYENQMAPIPEAAPHQVLAFLMAQRGLTQTKVANATGIHQSNLSQILRGKRKLTLEQVRIFAEYFKVERSVFV